MKSLALPVRMGTFSDLFSKLCSEPPNGDKLVHAFDIISRCSGVPVAAGSLKLWLCELVVKCLA